MGEIRINNELFGGNIELVELTQAEYNNLPSDKLNDNVLYAITDGKTAGGSNLASDIIYLNENEEESNVQFEIDFIKNQMSEASDYIVEEVNAIKSQMVTESGVPFQFAVNENGDYGYIIPDSEGADTFVPFKTITEEYLNNLRLRIIDPLKNASNNITDNSTWEDIITELETLYPDLFTTVLFSANNNAGSFGTFGANADASASVGSSLYLYAKYKENHVSQIGLITGEKYNVDKATKLIISYSASSTVSKPEATYTAFVKIGLFTSKNFNDSNAKMFTLANNFNSASGTITNDISSITGDYYIGVIIRAPYYYKATTTCYVSEIKLTNV